jgi:hypothetical protein
MAGIVHQLRPSTFSLFLVSVCVPGSSRSLHGFVTLNVKYPEVSRTFKHTSPLGLPGLGNPVEDSLQKNSIWRTVPMEADRVVSFLLSRCLPSGRFRITMTPLLVPEPFSLHRVLWDPSCLSQWEPECGQELSYKGTQGSMTGL